MTITRELLVNRILALEAERDTLDARLDELRRLRDQHCPRPTAEPAATADPAPAKKPHRAHRSPFARPPATVEALARKVLAILRQRGPSTWNELLAAAGLPAAELSAALNHNAWFAKDDESRAWAVTPAAPAAAT